MNCREFVDFILRYLDGETNEAECETFEAHIRDCPPCLTYLETYQQAVELGRGVCCEPEGPVSEEVPEALVQAVLAARRQG